MATLSKEALSMFFCSRSISTLFFSTPRLLQVTRVYSGDGSSSSSSLIVLKINFLTNLEPQKDEKWSLGSRDSEKLNEDFFFSSLSLSF